MAITQRPFETIDIIGGELNTFIETTQKNQVQEGFCYKTITSKMFQRRPSDCWCIQRAQNFLGTSIEQIVISSKPTYIIILVAVVIK